jgi:adenylate cyclase
MAFWGAPLKVEDHPEKAVIAAIDMIGELHSIKQALWERGFDLNLKIGIGINSGDAILGNIGSENKLNYTIVGDTVNVASRLQELTKFYECPIIISEITYKRLKKSTSCRVIDIINVRGKEKTIKIYEPLYFKDMQDIKNKKELCDITNTAFDLYQRKDFEKALQMYYMIDDGRLKDIFVNRCKKKLKA